jgi:YVTN family beta-propeller protein
MLRRGLSGVLTAVVTLGAVAPGHSQSAPSYKVAQTVALGAPDRWDYVVFDPPSHRVFVAHGDRVTVVDGHTGAIVGQVEGYPGGTHGVAISTATGRGYSDDGKAGEAKSFDLETLKAGKTLKTVEDADGMTLDPLTGHVFEVNGDSGNLTVINPQTDSVVATIDVGGKLEYAAANGAGKLYVNGAGNKEVVRIDTRTNAVDARWPIPGCTSPHGLAIDPKGHRLFSSCVNSRLIVLNTDTGAVVATLPIGRGTDAAAFDPIRHRVFSSNGVDGALTVIQQDPGDAYKVIETVKTAVTGRTLGIDPATGRLYLAAGTFDPATPVGGRPKILPDSLKLIFLDPVQ